MEAGDLISFSYYLTPVLVVTQFYISEVTPLLTVNFKQASQQLPGASWHFGPFLNG